MRGCSKLRTDASQRHNEEAKMSPNSAQNDQSIERLKSLWEEAVQMDTPPPSAAKAPAGGVNLRLNLLKALKATRESAQVAIETAAAIHTPADFAAWIKIGVEAISAVRSIYSSLVQEMRPIDYVTYVILSKYPNGASKAELESAVVKFLSDPASQNFAWYLGMTDRLIQRAQEPTKFPGWFDLALDKLSKGNMG
jgi:hypothetical protein